MSLDPFAKCKIFSLLFALGTIHKNAKQWLDKMDNKKRLIKCLIFFLACFSLLQTSLLAGYVYALENYKKHYLQGLEYKETEQYNKAIEAFDKAISENDRGQKKIRFYGMRYGEYLPHMEKGICHYLLKQYSRAIEELETSLRDVPTDEALTYLERAKIELAKLGTEEVFEFVEIPEELEQMKQAKEVNHYAVGVTIGNRNYKDKDVPAVQFAVQDATMVKEYLIKAFGYREGNIIFRTNATKGTFENIFGSVSDYRGKLYDSITPGKSDVFIYYSGHGAPNLETRRGYILPVDGNPNNVSISGYPLELLYSNLAKLQARSITVVTDACFSGGRVFKKASAVGIIVSNPLVELENTLIINASSGIQLSSWYPKKGHGLFTYYFLLGLSGAANSIKDDQITLSELSSYIQENVPYMARHLHNGRKQTPMFEAIDKDKVLIRFGDY